MLGSVAPASAQGLSRIMALAAEAWGEGVNWGGALIAPRKRPFAQYHSKMIPMLGSATGPDKQGVYC
jgi:hypothetical protein